MSVTDLASRRAHLPEIHQALRRGVEEQAFPGGACAVIHQGRLVHLSSTGDAQVVPARVAMSDDAIFDLASLTKAVGTTIAAALLVHRKQLSLEDPVVRFLPAFGRNGKKAVTIRQLLAHTSGLPAFRPYFLELLADPTARALFAEAPTDRGQLLAACHRGATLIRSAIENEILERDPGAAAVYSDLGFITLGLVIEAVTKETLDRFVEREISAELKLPTLCYRPLAGPRALGPPLVATGVFRPREPAPGQEEIVPAPDASRRAESRPGEVDDDNAYAMGGVSGHAGLFGSARDVATFGGLLLEELDGAMRLAPPTLWQSFIARDPTPGSTRTLGFDTPSVASCGRHLAASRGIGHLGFTGTSLWIDLERRLVVALLTNRVHPARANIKIRAFRPKFHDAVVEALDLVDASPVQP